MTAPLTWAEIEHAFWDVERRTVIVAALDAGELMAAALQRLASLRQCDDYGEVTVAWNAAYIEAGEALAAWRQAVAAR